MSADIVLEDVPKFFKRNGDQVLQGSNNTVIILGTDRAKKGPAGFDDGLGHIKADGKGKGTGTIHVIAGRKAEDPDLEKDESYLYLSRKTKADDNLDLGSVESGENDMPAAILKSDLLRLVGRKSVKICANDDQKHYVFLSGDKIRVVVEGVKFTVDKNKVEIDSPKVHLTGGCEGPWDDLFKSMITMLEMHNHLGSTGPTGPAKAGPSSTQPDSDLTLKKQSWDQKVKS